MNTPLGDLRWRLGMAMSSSCRVADGESWGKAEVMSKELALLRARYDSPLAHCDGQSVERAVLSFRRTGRLASYSDIKYVCVGAAMEFSGWRLLDEAPLLERLLNTAKLGPDRRRLRYFSCLLQSYWSFPRNYGKTSLASVNGWGTLRDWLAAQRRRLAASSSVKPPWFASLNDHANLFSTEPCIRYGRELLGGSAGSVNEVFTNLGVPLESWVREEVVYAEIRAVAGQDESAFKSCILRLIGLASGKGAIRISEAISKRCVALLVSRYASCSSHPEIMELRDAAITFIGNPWLHRAAWDASVLDENGHPDRAAREMVDGWLKVRLIKDFFGLLSEDRFVDDRRLKYWLRFEPVIDDMWFGLGANATNDNGQEYREFRRRAKGRLIDLSGPDPRNNAFMMRIGQFLMVEFGLTGNACFIYDYERLPPGIDNKLRSSGAAVMEIGSLKTKRKDRRLRLLHLGQWEREFDASICPLVGFRSLPSGSARSVEPRIELTRFASQYRLEVDDRTGRGGCLWVRTDDANPRVAESLKRWGFSYRPGRGWWKE